MASARCVRVDDLIRPEAAYNLGLPCGTTPTACARPAAKLPDGFPVADSNL